jgi:hypothetical protein
MSEQDNAYGKVVNAVVWLLLFVTIALAIVLLALGVLFYLPIELLKRCHRRWYLGSTERARHIIEEEARRFGGSVKWSD